LLRYAHRYFTQVAHTALTNASHALEERLARWLLMCHDRADGDDIPMTHELLSLMLNVRHAGVTLAVQALENARFVYARRGVITIVERSSLEEFAADCYGAGEEIVGEFEGNPAQ
jgi:CRP-like cAMP-binding protein